MKAFSTKISEISDKEVNDLKNLPISHNCNLNQFEGILKECLIKKRVCDVFDGEKLVYFFYGRPVFYREHWNMPVFLMFDFSKSKNGDYRVVPFDSGAYFNGYLDSIKKVSLEDDKNGIPLIDFCYESTKKDDTIAYAKKVVKYFYKSNESYYDNDINNQAKCYNAASIHYRNINAKKKYNDSFDERASAIEIQAKSDFSILDNTIKLAFIPKELISTYAPLLKKINSQIEIKTYTPGQLNKGLPKLLGVVDTIIREYLGVED